MDGTFCLKKIEELKPHVVTLDLQMPGMNGIDTLKEIMRRQPLPVIVVSSHSTEGASVTLKALGLGAFDFVTKPKDASAHMTESAAELIAKIKAAAVGKAATPGTDAGHAGAGGKNFGHKIGSASDQTRRHWNFHWWAAGAGIFAGATACGFSRNDSGRAAHARGLYRDVRATAG